MAKSTKAQQVSTGTPDSYTPEELADPTPPIRVTRAMLGVVPEEVKASVGTDSSQSSKSESMRSDKENPSRLPHAPTMENPSGQPERETDSTADLTAGDGQAGLEENPYDESLEGFDDDEEESDELEDDDEEPEETTPVPVAKKAAKKSVPASKKARSRTTAEDDFAGLV